MLDPHYSRQRQRRLQQILAERKLDAAVVGLPAHVYYFAAFRPVWPRHAAFAILADGRSLALSAGRVAESAADELLVYPADFIGTQRQEQPSLVAEKLIPWLISHKAARIGVDASAVSSQLLLEYDGDAEPLDSEIWRLRRPKDADELALMRRAAGAASAMYRRAGQILEPGIPELTVFSELHAAAVAELGEPLSDLLGNDYACGVGGGPPRKDHAAQSGQIYVLDVGPAYRGYFSDACRAFAIGRQPTDAQLRAHAALLECLKIVESLARPGARCREIFTAVDDHLKTTLGQSLPHHLGHGVGLQAHEFPHLNPHWDDTLIEGEIFTAEPGLYGPHLNGGIRLENEYLVTSSGVENLIQYPLDLS
jgi:Xaa-Pro dipeptidase